MKMHILVMRDIKANVYLPPIFVPNIFAAQRELGDMINGNDKREPWQKHPEDFELIHAGDWDSDNNSFDTPHDGSGTEEKQICVLSALKA